MGVGRLAAASLGLAAIAGAWGGIRAATAPGEIERGRHLAVLGDCEGCHDAPGRPAFAGGLPLNTPFGTIYSANITPDPSHGIGAMSEAQFYRAMHEGRDNRHGYLYAAFPYPYFTRMPRADVDAVYAYLRTVPPAAIDPPKNRLTFPASIRLLVGLWNWLNFHKGDFQPAPDQSAAWNRGAYIVTGPGHCGACHTPKNFLAGDEWDKPLQGGLIDNWLAPDLNGDPRGGLAGWSQDEVVEFLKTGRNARASGGGSMALVIQHSTSQMNDEDLADVALYLKSLPPTAAAGEPSAVDPRAMAAGAAIYRDQCAACHRTDGRGVSQAFPPLAGDALLQSRNPTTVVRYVLTGTQTVATNAKPTPFTMPAYAWKLSDQEIADVATYIRNSWGNLAPPVAPGQVAGLRRKVAAHPTRPSESDQAAPGGAGPEDSLQERRVTLARSPSTASKRARRGS